MAFAVRTRKRKQNSSREAEKFHGFPVSSLGLMDQRFLVVADRSWRSDGVSQADYIPNRVCVSENQQHTADSLFKKVSPVGWV